MENECKKYLSTESLNFIIVVWSDRGGRAPWPPPLWIRACVVASFSNPYIASPTSQLILQPFRRFTYVTAHSPTLLSLLLRQRLFTYVTWRAAHACKYNLLPRHTFPFKPAFLSLNNIILHHQNNFNDIPNITILPTFTLTPQGWDHKRGNFLLGC